MRLRAESKRTEWSSRRWPGEHLDAKPQKMKLRRNFMEEIGSFRLLTLRSR
jgi:hypothetical protein